MKKNLSWPVLIIIGIIGKIIGYIFSDIIIAQAIGTVGDICFIIGIIYFFIFLYKKNKKKSEK